MQMTKKHAIQWINKVKECLYLSKHEMMGGGTLLCHTSWITSSTGAGAGAATDATTIVATCAIAGFGRRCRHRSAQRCCHRCHHMFTNNCFAYCVIHVVWYRFVYTHRKSHGMHAVRPSPTHQPTCYKHQQRHVDYSERRQQEEFWFARLV